MEGGTQGSQRVARLSFDQIDCVLGELTDMFFLTSRAQARMQMTEATTT